MSELALGLDIGGTKMMLASLQDNQPTVVGRFATGIKAGPEDIEGELLRQIAALPRRPSSLGIAIPGLVGSDGAVVACDVLPRITGWHPRALGDKLRCPVRVINDAEAALVGETHDLAGDRTIVVVMVGTGIGASFLVNGSVCRGAHGWAGELGSIPIGTAKGIQTLDALAGGRPLLERIDSDSAAALAKIQGLEKLALAEVLAAGRALGLGLATVVNLLNPELLVLEGGTLDLPGYLDEALAIAQGVAMSEPWQACTVRRSRFGPMLVALGAAKFAQNVK